MKTLGAAILIAWMLRNAGSYAAESMEVPPWTGGLIGAHGHGIYIPETLTWEDWLMTYSKSYNGEEHDTRRDTYLANINQIEEHNERYEQGLETSRLGVNQFAALSVDEYINRYMGSHNLTASKNYADSDPDRITPVQLDWRDKGAVTEVKNQGLCGSCWSFASTGAIEGHWAVTTGELVSLSEQQLMDCSGAYGDMSCGGGLMDNAYQYVIDDNGIDSEDDYPYKMKDEPCDSDREQKHVAMISDYKDVRASDKELAAAVSLGPVSVGISAGNIAFQLYRGGIYEGKLCQKTLNHGVLVVGYTPEYWIVKNSWASTWGDHGYIKMSRGEQYGEEGVCGILQAASYPIVNHPRPNPHPHPRPPPPHPSPTPSPKEMDYYENPWTSGGCHDGEQAVQVRCRRRLLCPDVQGHAMPRHTGRIFCESDVRTPSPDW